MRLCPPKKSHLLPLACRIGSKRRKTEILRVFWTNQLSLSCRTFSCVQSSLYFKDQVPKLLTLTKMMTKDPHPALVGPSQTSRPWCSISSAAGQCRMPSLNISHLFPPGCIIPSVFNLLIPPAKTTERNQPHLRRRDEQTGWIKLHPVATFRGLAELKSLWLRPGILTIFYDLHRQPIIKLSFWMASLRPRMHSRECDLCPASIHDTLLTLHTLTATLNSSLPLQKVTSPSVFFVFFLHQGHIRAHGEVWQDATFINQYFSGIIPSVEFTLLWPLKL